MTRRQFSSPAGTSRQGASLLLCEGCSRHFRRNEPACPFCGAEVTDAALSRPRAAAPAPGASRAQRYAARAAVVAVSSVSFSCGSGDQASATNTTQSSRGGATQSGGAGMNVAGSGGGLAGNKGGTTSGGTATVGGAANGGSNTSGGAANGGLNASGGTANGGAGQSGSACPGRQNPAQNLCRNTLDCAGVKIPGGFGGARCVMREPARTGCGNPTFLPPRECDPNAVGDAGSGCAADAYCQPGVCGTATCVAKCTADSCGEAAKCVDDVCVAKLCNEAGAQACAEGFSCDPASARANPVGCVAETCGPEHPCGVNEDCSPGMLRADAHGCVQTACTSDTECDCGYCVNALCEATLGFCYEEIAMPYGTVWPDEEFV